MTMERFKLRSRELGVYEPGESIETLAERIGLPSGRIQASDRSTWHIEAGGLNHVYAFYQDEFHPLGGRWRHTHSSLEARNWI